MQSLEQEISNQNRFALLIWSVLFGAIAGGMGWGIRGQYGHETGAMIAGVLVGFVLVLFYLPNASSLKAARTVALLALGVSFGGSMTYGQTIGLTHDAPLIGNWSALRWGLFGLFIKGGIWIGFAGAFLGLALSGKRYQPWELLLVMLAMLVLLVLGIWLINTPYDPASKVLPPVYFSDSWKFEPDGELRPRREIWGGLLLALVGLTAYFHLVRRDLLARNLALIGFVSGGFGFSIGQSVQAFHAWNPELYQTGWLGKLDPFMNWWNMMETSFGAIFGGLLAGGLWLNRRLIIQNEPRDQVIIKPIWEFALFGIFLILLVCAEFVEVRMISLFLEFGFIMALIPAVGILGGRFWPYLFALPVVAVPIAGKTLRELAYKHQEISPALGWLLYVVVPLTLASAVAIWLAHKGGQGQGAGSFSRAGLLFTTWMYFGLNFAFFRFPWPWREWTGRTPSGIIFTVCAVSLTLAAIMPRLNLNRNETEAALMK